MNNAEFIKSIKSLLGLLYGIDNKTDIYMESKYQINVNGEHLRIIVRNSNDSIFEIYDSSREKHVSKSEYHETIRLIVDKLIREVLDEQD